MLPDSLKGRFYHSTMIVHTDFAHKRLIHFGGMDEWPEGEVDTWHPVTETIIVELGEWSAPHSQCCYGIQLIHLDTRQFDQCVLW